MSLSPSELQMLDTASKSAEADLNAIIQMLERLNTRLDRTFAEIDAIRARSLHADRQIGSRQ